MACVKLMFMVALVVLHHSGVAASEFDVPDKCKGKPFCDVKTTTYDKYDKDIKYKFKLIKEKLSLEEDYVGAVGETKWFRSEYNCGYKTEVIKPYHYVEPNGTTRLIVQTDYYQQTFKTTKCLDSDDFSPEGDQCFKELTTTSAGKCKTKYTTLILYAYNTGKERIERIPVPVPVCCFCSFSS